MSLERAEEPLRVLRVTHRYPFGQGPPRHLIESVLSEDLANDEIVVKSLCLPSLPVISRERSVLRLAFTRSVRWAQVVLVDQGAGLRLAFLKHLGLALPAVATIAYDPLPGADRQEGPITQAQAAVRRMLYAKMDLLVLVSAAQTNAVARQLGPAPRVAFMPMSVDLDFFLRRRPPEELHFFMVDGTYRDYETVTAALAKLPERARSLCVAHRRVLPQDVQETLTRARAAGCRISTRHQVDGTELRRLYEGCCAVVVPIAPSSQPAGLTAVLEATAMECAIVATSHWSTNEYVRDGGTALLVPSADPAGFAVALRSVWEDRELARRLRAGAASNRADLSFSTSIAQLRTALTSLRPGIRGRKQRP